MAFCDRNGMKVLHDICFMSEMRRRRWRLANRRPRSRANRVVRDVKKKRHGTRVYGPVPSRRLGASLGIDLVQPKTCDYDCVYCQLGRTSHLTTKRAPYAGADEILAELIPRLESGARPDYVTMAGSGEPTLNSELPAVISRVKEATGIPVAVITNGSLLADPAVSEACAMADVVLPSLDAGDEETFEKVNRPCAGLDFDKVAAGLIDFRRSFDGAVWLEVMMLDGINSSDSSMKSIGEVLEEIRPDEVHLNTVVRPPAEPFARSVDEGRLREIASLLRPRVTVLREAMRGEGAVPDGSIDEVELLELVRRRPCTRRHIASAFGTSETEALKVLSRLASENGIISELSDGEVFYRALPG